MSDTAYPVFQHYGTNAQRLAFTPAPASGTQPLYIWYETDTNNYYIYTTAWQGPYSAAAAATALKFGSTTINLLSTAPTSGQFLKYDGTNIVGAASSGSSVLYGTSSPLIQMPNYETKAVQGQNVTLATGNSQTLLSLGSSISGTVLGIWVANQGAPVAGSQIKISTDGASSPQATFDFANLGGYFAPTNTLVSALRGSYFHGSTSGGTVYLRWPLYFRNGIDIEFANSSGSSATLWWIVVYTTDFTSDLRLYTSYVPQSSPVSALNLATTTYNFLSQATNTGIAGAAVNAGGTGYVVNDIINVVQSGAVGGAFKVTSVSGGVITGVSLYTAGGGYSVATGLSCYGGSGSGATLNITSVGTNSPALISGFYLAAIGASAFTYLEADINLYLDGEGTPSFQSSGTEDFFTSQGYFNNGARLQTPWMFQNATNANTVIAFIDLLDYLGGMKFSNGGILRWDGVTHDSGRITTTVTFSYDLLYYQ